MALPLLPFVWASTKVDADIVVCSSSGWAHGVRTSGRKIVYCHSPAKWLYRRGDYLGAHPGTGARIGLRVLSRGLQSYDRWAATSADRYLTNSSFIADEIAKIYGIDATIVPPPGGINESIKSDTVAGLAAGFYLVVARLLPYKNVAPTVDAFRELTGRLVVVGDGPERPSLKATAPSNVTFLGEVDDHHLRWLYANCRALIAASREDYGLTPVEAGSFGKPVAALRWGGFLDTVVPGTTGVYFDSATPSAIASAIVELEATSWDDAAIKAHAASFDENHFVDRIRAIVDEVAAMRS
jgi:glycosyltransferase involved in cell wall biosynthesis